MRFSLVFSDIGGKVLGHYVEIGYCIDVNSIPAQ